MNNVVFANNTMRGFGWREGPLENTGNYLIINNHVHAANPLVMGGVNTVASGDQDSLFVDFANGDFTPTSLLRERGFEPRLPVDLNRDTFPTPAAPGALAFMADVLQMPPPPPSLSDTPLADLLALLNATGGQSSVHDYRDATTPNANLSYS